MATWYLIEYENKLAVTMGWNVSWSGEPEEERDLWVSDEPWNEKYYSRFDPSLMSNNVFRCFNRETYGYQMLYTEGWQHITETRPIKPPGRGGKDWRWSWSSYSHKYIKEYI